MKLTKRLSSIRRFAALALLVALATGSVPTPPAHAQVAAGGDKISSNTVGAMTMAVGTTTTASAPVAPSTPAVAVVSMTQLNLSWRDLSSNETGFLIERCAGSTCTNFAQIAQTAANAISFQNTGLVKATTYRYRVRAFNSTGNSPYTSIVNGATKSR